VSTTRLLARPAAADTRVLELFAFLHEVRREHDGCDPLHGERAAELARELNGRVFSLDPAAMQQLGVACRHHSATAQAKRDATRRSRSAGTSTASTSAVSESARPPTTCVRMPRGASEMIARAHRRSLAGW